MFKSIEISENQSIFYADVKYDRLDVLFKALLKNKNNLSRLEKMTNDRRKSEWMTIREIVLKTMGKEEDIIYDSQNKPHFKKSKKGLSISHSHHRVAIHISKEKNPGVDLQVVTPKIERIKSKFLNEKEQVKTSIDTIELTAYWSIKEALFKMYGKNDAYLKENFEVTKFQFNGKNGKAIGSINTPSMKQSFLMKFKLIDEYMLAYNVNS